MGKTISIKVLFGIYLLLMAGKVFAFSCNVDGEDWSWYNLCLC